MKKILLTFLFGVIILPAFSQAKKVAILETVDRDGSVSYAHKLMLRANLAKAVTNTPGYEAYDRTDMDAILGEQNFQRTGMVSDDQIKKLGEMTGAEYILVAEAVKVDDANMFITAKILNVETAQTERTDNALMNMSAADIQHGCESLANKLLGIMTKSTPTSDTKISQDTKTTNQQKNTKNSNPVNHLLIGTIKTFEDGTSGVVFYATDDGHGLVVSLVETTTQWLDARKYQDIGMVPNEEDANSSLVSGFNYTNAILTQLGTSQAPAAAWCKSLGSQWYLPTVGELIYLFKIANLGDDESGPISTTLTSKGGGYFNGWYWSCSEQEKDEAWNVSASGRCSSEDKKEELKVRAVRAF